ncbi:hypothetical protein PIB30_016251 [Stylosanthes scabra]|uniref:Uncharacterized protein n=1 Tax=Stylosanthes scabra TaxID=79078 RepID=A0ABU6Y969_9FABA|nr:hypothetical protein [Stylosanthes scabra]
MTLAASPNRSEEKERVMPTPTPVQSSALGPGDSSILKSSFSNYQRFGSLTPTPYPHTCEFVSNPLSWDQCLTASLLRICEGSS